MNEKSLNMLEWDDFELISKGSIGNIHDKYENFKLLSKIVDELPKKELLKRGWIDSNMNVTSFFKLFQDINSKQLNPLFRKSSSSNDALVSMWLSKVSSDAKFNMTMGNISNFNGLTKSDLKEISKLSTEESIIEELPILLAKKGIILIYELFLPSMKLDGAVFKLSSGNPVIGMSFRYSRIDNFWFTLMHELSHIVLHFDKLDTPILDDLEIDSQDLIEKQANRLTKSTFVERHAWRTCKAKYNSEESSVIEFANELNIHPAIVAGLLRKDKNRYDIYTNIINAIDLRMRIFKND